MRASDICSMKFLLISAGFLSLGLGLKLWLPCLLRFLAFWLPLLYVSVQSWLTPPYLYLVVNGIIITIAASSKFQQKGYTSAPVENIVVERRPSEVLAAGSDDALVLEDQRCSDERLPAISARRDVTDSKDDEEDYFVISRSDYPLSRSESSEMETETYLSVPETEKPSMSARISHRRTSRASPEGSRLRGVTKRNRNETLESTWKAITEGRPMPLTRHLKKSETFEMAGRPRTDWTPVKKSETFHDRTASPSPSSSPATAKLRREPSLSQDELNRRVEAFIQKFNEDMRLQRQESFKQYMEMVNRGSR